MKATPVTPPGSLNTTADPTSSLNAPSTINFTGIAPKQTASKEPVPRALQHVPVTYKGKPAIAAFDPESGGMQIIPDMAPPPSASGAGGAAAGPPGPGQFTPDSLERAAVAYRITGKMPPLGMGKQPERFALLNKVAEQDKILGLSPAASVQKQFATHADAHALDTLQNLSSTAEASETKALGQIAIIRDVASKVPRTQYPFINAAIQSGKINLLGDSDSQQLANAIQTYASEYGKIIEGSTGSVSGASDASMKAAKRLVDASMNPQTLNDVLSLMQREMDLTLMGYGAAITHVTEQMIGNGQAPAAPPPQTPPPATPPPGATRNLNTMKSRRKALGLE
jgi:hypothetical protein